MSRIATTFAALTLVTAAGALAQAPAQPAAGSQEGFFRPSGDLRLVPRPATPVAPVAPQAAAAPAPALDADAAEQIRLAEEARLARMEASMDRIEQRNQRAIDEANRQLPVITSPTDGTARIMSPLDGTAPLVSGLGR